MAVDFTRISLLKISSVGRQILTKRPGTDDDVGEADAEDITSLYKNAEGISRYQQQLQHGDC